MPGEDRLLQALDEPVGPSVPRLDARVGNAELRARRCSQKVKALMSDRAGPTGALSRPASLETPRKQYSPVHHGKVKDKLGRLEGVVELAPMCTLAHLDFASDIGSTE